MFQEIEGWEDLASTRTNDLSESTRKYVEIAKQLIATNRYNYISRANFILEQLQGDTGELLFHRFREDWDIYKFHDKIITATDFKRGFLYKFRDHSDSWLDSETARGWFLDSPEAIFVRQYEYWIMENGAAKCLYSKTGSYKEILNALLADGNYAVLASPAFSRSELDYIINKFAPVGNGYSLDQIIQEFIALNPNFEY